MGSRRDALAGRALLVGVWVAATMVAATVTWAAVATFGPERGASTGRVLSQSDVHRQLVGDRSSAPTTSTPTHGTGTGKPPAGHHHGSGPTGTTHNGQSGPPGGGSGPTTSPPTTSHQTTTPPSHPGGSSGGQQRPPTHHTSSPPPPSQSRSWSISGGNVGASCSGDTITLLYATPQDGWTVTVGDNGPEAIEVQFHSDEAESQLSAECVGGAPVAQIEEDDEWGGGAVPPGGDE